MAHDLGRKARHRNRVIAWGGWRCVARSWLAVLPLLLLLGPSDLLAPLREAPSARMLLGPEAPVCPDGWAETPQWVGGDGHAVATDGTEVGPPAPGAKVWSDLASL